MRSFAAAIAVAALYTSHANATSAEQFQRGFKAAYSECPLECNATLPIDWAVYRNVDRFSSCNEAILLDMNIHNSLNDPNVQTSVRACTPKSISSPIGGTSGCFSVVEKRGTFQLASWGASSAGKQNPTISASKRIQSYLSNDAKCDKNTNSIFGYSSGVVVGVYVGPELQKSGAASTLVQAFISDVAQNGMASRKLAQYCGIDSGYYMGIVADAAGDIDKVQETVKGWSQARCVNSSDQTKSLANSSFFVAATNITSPAEVQTSNLIPHSTALQRRADCRTIQVNSGDGCYNTAQRCGISQSDFDKYNPGTCSKPLQAGQYVCCSSGTLPDRSPKPLSNGQCYPYTVRPGDTCSQLAATWSTTIQAIEDNNKFVGTWGWSGCGNLQMYATICLSTGYFPPMPATISNAVCGPQVPGTQRPSNNSLASLNQCPLNACCDIWGQCGTTDEFCTMSQSSTGNPGTAAPKQNGCISNCGTSIINNPDKVANFMKVGYFESWSVDRPCLKLDALNIDTSKYTHIHFAFANITTDFNVEIKAVQGQFNKFKTLTGVKKILSFGGWSFSTSQDTYPIFRQSVTDAQRGAFANNVINFMNANNLDGVDFDWEYPGATDIPDVPPGSPQDGDNYLKFLQLMRSKMPSGKTLSIAAPASYWYLRGFPIKEMAKVVDYIIYMTYDLHGQWDYDKKWSLPGCPQGSCLRSHVNFTETLNSLSMITKAGVGASKVIVGLASYGRSFQMAQAGCTGEQCPFVGPASGAQKGACTGTAGYISNAEIGDIMKRTGAKPVWDWPSSSQILNWDGNQWVSFLLPENLDVRTNLYRDNFKFGGTSEWAIDLGSYYSIPEPTFDPCNGNYNTLDDIPSNAPPYCMNTYITQVLSKTLKQAISDYQSILKSGYDDKFNTYQDYAVKLVPSQLQDYMKKHANDHFSCSVHYYRQCCLDCSSAQACASGNGCENCPKGGSGYVDQSRTCPNFVPVAATTDKAPDEYTFTCNDKNAFFSDISNSYGIDQSWVQFDDHLVWINAGCEGSPDPNAARCHKDWHGYPDPVKSITIPNPKDTIGKAMANYQTLSSMLDSAAFDQYENLYPLDGADVVDGAALPVFMAVQAVESMKAVVKAAGEISEAQRKEMILNFIAGALMLLPIVGEVVGAEIATLGRILLLTADAGNIAFTVYGVVQDPKSAVFALFGALIGAKDFGKAAGYRRGINGDGIKAFGPTVSNNLDKIGAKLNVCY